MHNNIRHRFLEPRIFLAFITLILVFVVLFYCVTSMIISVGYQAFSDRSVDTKPSVITVVLDAGHGGEDPGAVTNSAIEKDLNLLITNKLATLLKLSDYHVVMTRSEDRLLYNSGEEDRKKYFDLYNRQKLAESYDNAIFVSIHMNKFPMEECKGLQTFYGNKNEFGKILAEEIQKSALMLDASNHRQSKASDDTIFLLKNLSMPAVLIECGFISNPQESLMLLDEDYQNKLAFALYNGICKFLEDYQGENKLCM